VAVFRQVCFVNGPEARYSKSAQKRVGIDLRVVGLAGIIVKEQFSPYRHGGLDDVVEDRASPLYEEYL
jgi:hypothetical protein